MSKPAGLLVLEKPGVNNRTMKTAQSEMAELANVRTPSKDNCVQVSDMVVKNTCINNLMR